MNHRTLPRIVYIRSVSSAYDIRLDSTGDLPNVGALVSDAELVAQRVGVRLRTWLGEWTLDSSQGIDWRTLIGAKPFPLDLVVTLLRREIDQTPGVLRTAIVSSSFAVDTGEAAISYDVTCDDGSHLAVSVSPSAVGNRAAGVLIRPGTIPR